MPFNCRVCGNSDFSEIDGLYYCTECQTQSEDLILQEASQNDFTLGGNEIRLSQPRNVSSRKKPKPSLGRPWTIYEAYQIIILAQADSLIALGASDDLKDVVFTIWANYLAKLGVAFCKHEKLVPDIVAKTKYGRYRELYRGTLNNPLNRTKRPLIQNKRASKKVDSNGNIYEGSKVDDDKDDNIVFLNDSLENGMKLRHSSVQLMAIRSPEWMNMSKTLAVCYIGLMFTNPNFLPCDIVRFVYESKVPFLSVTHLLPDDMVLSGHDKTLFESIRMDSNALIIETNRLLAYLNLDKMPRPDITVLVPRFVRELCLPGEFATYCLHLMEMVPFLWKKITKTGYNRQEVVAMAYIILALKLALGLDDTSELRLSRYSRKLKKLLTPDVKLFVWSDWRRFMMRKSRDEFSAFRELTGDISKSRLQHLDELVECYCKTESDRKRHSIKFLVNCHNNPKRSLKPEFRSSIRKPLEIALDRLEGHRRFKHDVARRNKEDLAHQSQEFQRCTLSHIVDISGFREHFKDILSENKAFVHLLEKYSLPRTEILEYNAATSEENLVNERHGSYLWLLHETSSIIDCPIMELDKITMHMQRYFAMKMNGDVKPQVVCCQHGLFYASEERLCRDLPFALES